MLGVIVGAVLKALEAMFVEEVEGKPGGDRRRQKRVTVTGYAVLIASLVLSGVLLQRAWASAQSDETAWRAKVDAHIEATPKALEEFRDLRRTVTSDRATVLSALERHEDYMRALLLDRGQDPDRVAARAAARRARLEPSPTPTPEGPAGVPGASR